MEKNSKVRIPKQKRSILRKEALREKALSLFCSKGFQQTTTNQIAEEAGMSIGSLYEYYANKEEILYDIVDEYFTVFLNEEDKLRELFFSGIRNRDKRKWIRSIIENLIESHEASKKFNIELHYLYFQLDKVREAINKQKMIVRKIAAEALDSISGELTTDDTDIAAVIFCDSIEKTVDRICLYPLTIDNKRLISDSVEMIYRYLFMNRFEVPRMTGISTKKK